MSPTATADAWRDGWWLAAQRRESPNHDERPQGIAITLVVVHSISLPPGVYGGSCIEDLFTNRLDWDAHPYFDRIRGLRVSAHFLVRRDGSVVQFVPCDKRAWHAGRSSWRGHDACNDYSVGVELEGLEGETFDAPQYDALARVVRALRACHPIEAVVGHEHVAPGRKVDPGPGFDWTALQRLLDAPTSLLPALSVWPSSGTPAQA